MHSNLTATEVQHRKKGYYNRNSTLIFILKFNKSWRKKTRQLKRIPF